MVPTRDRTKSFRKRFNDSISQFLNHRSRELFLLSSTGQIKNCTYEAFFCRVGTLLWSVCYKLTDACFLVAGWRVTVGFGSKYKILWGETRTQGVTIHKKTELKMRIYIIFPTPYNIRLTHVGVEGVTFIHCSSSMTI